MFLDYLCVAVAKPDIDPEILTFIPAETLKRLSHGRNTVGRIRILLSSCKQDTDAADSIRLLPARRERPRCRRAAEHCDEVAAFHVQHNALLPLLHTDFSRSSIQAF